MQRVLIVGAGPVGLLLAAELGLRGVPVTLLEERAGLMRHPKANTQTARSMEIYRRHGFSRRLRDGGMPADRATDVAYFTRLFGHELHRVPLPSPREAEAAARAGDAHWPTPEPQFRVTQMTLEPLLLERALSFPSVTLRLGCRAVALTQDDAGVRLQIENANGAREELAADWLAGCDGGKSLVRRELGIRYRGGDGLEMEFMGGPMLAVYFRAPTLLARFPHRDAWMHWIMHPAARAIVVVIDPLRHEFLTHVQLKPGQSPEDIDFAARLAAIAGEPLPHEILSSALWRAGLGLVAERYREGRCLLVGDAVHLFTPTGGFGLNTGIEDAFNLGWKLAAVCNGIAPPTLLDSYDSERRPIGARNTGFALRLAQHNGACPVSDALDDPGPAGDAARIATSEHLARFAHQEFDTPGIQLGARYDGSPIVIGDGSTPPPDDPGVYIPSGVPGGRLPHAWLPDGSALFDRLGQEFTLLVLRDDADSRAWQEAAARIGMDLTLLALPAEKHLHSVLGADAVLVRPDQHIAWRGTLAADAQRVLQQAIGYAA